MTSANPLAPVEKVCYLLGAGDSFDSDQQLPLMGSFFRPEDLETRGDLKQFLTDLFPGRGPSEYNLEDALAFLDLGRQRTNRWDPGAAIAGRLDSLYRTILQIVRERLSIPSGQGSKPHFELLRTLGPKDTVITLNYDLVVDQTLREVRAAKLNSRILEIDRVGKLHALLSNSIAYGGGVPVSLTASEREGGFYLKLHGSLDWVTCRHQGCVNSQTISIESPSGSAARLSHEADPCRQCGTALSTMIVPPITSKRIDDSGKLSLIWNLAAKELAAAGRIVIMGVSLAASDFELRWLLSHALYARNGRPVEVCLVNPDPEARTRVLKCLPRANGDAWGYQDRRAYLEGNAIAGPFSLGP